jgi:hypothetical protein
MAKAELKKEFGWRRIWKLYGFKSLFSCKNRLFYTSVLLTLTLLCLLVGFFSKNDYYLTLLKMFIDLGISILPNLLGFNLGAYALIVGFLSNEKLLQALCVKNEEEQSDKLEDISGVFAMNIVVQAFTLFWCFIGKSFMAVSTDATFMKFVTMFDLPILYTLGANLIYLLATFFLITYSILLIIQSVINIFDFSQLFNHFSQKS